MGVIAASLLLAMLAVARLTRLAVTDRLTVAYRRWVATKYGPDSMAAYLAHCTWCTSAWVALFVMPPAVLWPTSPYVMVPMSILAASYVVGLLARLED